MEPSWRERWNKKQPGSSSSGSGGRSFGRWGIDERASPRLEAQLDKPKPPTTTLNIY